MIELNDTVCFLSNSKVKYGQVFSIKRVQVSKEFKPEKNIVRLGSSQMDISTPFGKELNKLAIRTHTGGVFFVRESLAFHHKEELLRSL